MEEEELKVAFVQGRPYAHPTHAKYAHCVQADFFHVDYKVRYHDLPEASAPRRYFSWLFSALLFPKKKYDVIFTEEAYFMAGLMKWLGLLRKDQKIISLMNTHTLYFLNHNRYSPSTTKANIKLFKSYDGFLCGSQLQEELLYNLIGKDYAIPVYTIFNGVERARLEKLRQITPDVTSPNIVFIGAVSNSNRVWYKGLDLMLSAFRVAKGSLPQLTFTVIGQYDEVLKESLLDQYCPEYKSSVFFVGNVSAIENYLKEAGLYLHSSRGEAWGISVTEAMAAGVVPLVSDSTGSKEAVVKVDQRLVTTSDIHDIAHKILWYYQLPAVEKQEMSQKCKEIIAAEYQEEHALENFKNKFQRIVKDLGVKKKVRN